MTPVTSPPRLPQSAIPVPAPLSVQSVGLVDVVVDHGVGVCAFGFRSGGVDASSTASAAVVPGAPGRGGDALGSNVGVSNVAVSCPASTSLTFREVLALEEADPPLFSAAAP